MAGRGRNRGRGLSFSVESLGFGRGESLPGSIPQPPPLFPPLEYKPLPLNSGEEYEYLLALKQEFRASVKDSPYFIKPSDKKRDIERYSDKYTVGNQENGDTWVPDWSLLPGELKPKVRRKRKVCKVAATIKPKIPATRVKPEVEKENITEALEQLEKKEVEQEEDAGKEEKEGEEEEDAEDIEEDYYEDDMEEETDYNLNYFDNGEGFGADEDDDLDEGPVY